MVIWCYDTLAAQSSYWEDPQAGGWYYIVEQTTSWMDHLVKLDESVYLTNHKFLMLILKQIITVAEKAWDSIPSLAKRTIWFLYLVQVTPFDREGLASDICSKKGPPDQSLRPSIWPGQVSRASFDCVCVVLKRRSWLISMERTRTVKPARDQMEEYLAL